jgi:hypothetical protein
MLLRQMLLTLSMAQDYFNEYGNLGIVHHNIVGDLVALVA